MHNPSSHRCPACPQEASSHAPNNSSQFCSAWCCVVWNILLASGVSSSSSVPLPTFHPSPASLLTQWCEKLKKSLTQCQCCSATTKTLVCHQHFSHFKSKIQHCTMRKKISSTTAETRSQSQERKVFLLHFSSKTFPNNVSKYLFSVPLHFLSKQDFLMS